MAKKVYIDVIVDDKGTTKKVAVESKKLAENLKDSSRGALASDRAIKGAAQASSNGIKNFSKMSGAIEGGLVPAYAKLAATLFAVSAGFRFLEGAANYRALTQAQQEFAAKTGRSLSLLTKSLQDATGGQLQFQEAAQAAAIGAAAGLTNEQLTRLAAVAKNASLALGRDLTDSFNRLTRGVTKAEPELLDELGIILRLDTATKKYATSINKAQDALTPFERSQAVANEVLAQGEEKFGDLNVQVNSFTRLAKSVDDAIKKITQSLQPLADFFANTLSSNIEATMALLGLFGASFTRSLLPATQPMAAPSRADIGSAIQGYSGSEAVQDRLNTGAFTQKDIKSITDSNNNALKGRGVVFEKANKEMLASNKKVLKSMTAITKIETQKQGALWLSMSGRVQASFFLLQAQWGTTLGTMLFVARGFMTVLTGILSFAGIVAAIVLSYGAIKQAIFELTATDAEKKIRETNKAVSESIKDMGLELERMSKEGKKAKNQLEELVRQGNFLSNIDFKGLKDFTFETQTRTSHKGLISKTTLQEEGNTVLQGIIRIFSAMEDQTNLTKAEVQELGSELKFLTEIKEGDISLDDQNLERLNKLALRLSETNGLYFESSRALKAYQMAISSSDQSLKSFNESISEQLQSYLPGLISQQGSLALGLAEAARVTREQIGGNDLDIKGDLGQDLLQRLKGTFGAKEGQELFDEFTSLVILLPDEPLSKVFEAIDLEGLEARLSQVGDAAIGQAATELEAINTAKSTLLTSETKLANMEKVTQTQRMAHAAQAVTVAKNKASLVAKEIAQEEKNLKILKGKLGPDSESLRLVNAQLVAMRAQQGAADAQVTLAEERSRRLKEEIGLENIKLAIQKGQLETSLRRQVEDAKSARVSSFIERASSGTGLGREFERRKAVLDATRTRDRGVKDLATAQKNREDRRSSAVPITEQEANQMANEIEKASTNLKTYQEELSKVKEESSVMNDIGASVFSNFDSAIDGLIDGTKSLKEAFGDMAISILSDIAKMITKMAIMNMLSSAFPGFGGGGVATPPDVSARRGGMFETVPGYSTGGIARGRQAGYPAILHGTEAVVPLPNGKEIPVQMQGGNGDNNNVVVNVNMDGSSSQENSQGSDQRMKEMGRSISQAVQEELQRQKRPGGILSPLGAA